jgi:hypothetical protein
VNMFYIHAVKCQFNECEQYKATLQDILCHIVCPFSMTVSNARL